MAQSGRDIKRRIQTVQNTQQITKAMEMIAAAKLRRAQDRVQATRPYYNQLESAINRIMKAVGRGGADIPEIAQERSGNRTCLVVVTADRGLAGGYNANIIRQAERFLQDNPETQMIIVGRRGRDYFRRRNVDFLAEYTQLGDSISFRQAEDIGSVIEEFYIAGLFDRVQVLYNEFINTVTQRPTFRTILPFTGEEQPEKGDEGRTSGVAPLYIYEPSVGEVLQTMLPLYIQTALFQAFVEANASEQSSRMNAMRSATDNAGELIKELNLSFNRARQASITTEISEIVGGAEALGSD